MISEAKFEKLDRKYGDDCLRRFVERDESLLEYYEQYLLIEQRRVFYGRTALGYLGLAIIDLLVTFFCGVSLLVGALAFFICAVYFWLYAQIEALHAANVQGEIGDAYFLRAVHKIMEKAMSEPKSKKRAKKGKKEQDE